jgi:hypothetical protein
MSDQRMNVKTWMFVKTSAAAEDFNKSTKRKDTTAE